jgi:hypothetical protein
MVQGSIRPAKAPLTYIKAGTALELRCRLKAKAHYQIEICRVSIAEVVGRRLVLALRFRVVTSQERIEAFIALGSRLTAQLFSLTTTSSDQILPALKRPNGRREKFANQACHQVRRFFTPGGGDKRK